MPNMPQYIYHDEKQRLFFGKYNEVTKDVLFELEWDKVNKTYIRTGPIIPAESPIIPAVDLASAKFTKVDKTLELDHTGTGSKTSTTPTLSPTLEGTFNILNTENKDISITSAIQNQTNNKLRSNEMAVSTWWWQEMKTV